MPVANVELLVSDTIYAGWKSVAIKQSVRAIASGFDISLTDRWDAVSQPWTIEPGDECELRIAGQNVVDGFTDEVDLTIDANSKTIRVAGRDQTCDIVDCSMAFPTGHFNSPIDVLSLAKALCKPYGITASANVPVGEPISLIDVKESETVFQVLDRAARSRGLLMIPDGSGGILFTRAGQTNAGFQLVYGQNIKSASAKFSMKDRFSEYVVKSQLSMDVTSPEASAAMSAKATDPGVDRFRRLTILDDASGEAVTPQTRANWEAASRLAKSESVEVSIVGFQKPNGSLWKINELITTVIPILGINQELLISDLTFEQGDQGSITRMVLCPKEAFNELPLVSKNDGLIITTHQESK